MYKLQSGYKGQVNSVIRLSDLTSIPFDPDNTDYQAFLKYQAEGGVVLPADNNEQTA
jgi:hypothetical protein